MSGKVDFKMLNEISGRRPMLRVFEVAFSTVAMQNELFLFYFKGNLICEIEKEWFDCKQRDFFESISDPA